MRKGQMVQALEAQGVTPMVIILRNSPIDIFSNSNWILIDQI